MTLASPSPSLEIEPASMKSSGRCACCGKARRTAWGFVYRDGGPRACYFVEWTTGGHGAEGASATCVARVDVVVGDWFDGTTEDDREAISLEYQLLASGPSFSMSDAAGRPAAEIGRARKGADVGGTALGDEVLRIARAVLEEDARFAELVSAASPSAAVRGARE